jgi:hypothetical protein
MQPARFVIADKLTQRRLVKAVQHVAELFMVTASVREIRTVGPAQSADQSVAVLPADLTVFVAVAIV